MNDSRPRQMVVATPSSKNLLHRSVVTQSSSSLTAKNSFLDIFHKTTNDCKRIFKGKPTSRYNDIDITPIVCTAHGVLVPPKKLSIQGTGENSQRHRKNTEKNATILELYQNCYIGNKKKVIQALQSQLLDVNYSSRDGWTPLCVAVGRGHIETVIVLIDRFHANVNKAVVLNGMTPLHLAVESGSITMVRVLLYRKADVNRFCISQKTPLHLACEYGLDDVVKMLLKAGADLTTKDLSGFTAFFYAVLKGHLSLVLWLLESNDASQLLQTKDHNGKTALFHACKCGNLPLVKILVDNGAQLEMETDTKMTCLDEAAQHNRLDVVIYILEEASKMNVTTLTAQAAFLSAAKSGHEKIIFHLLQSPTFSLNARNIYDENALHLACKHGYVSLVKLFLRLGLDVNSRRNDGVTPLFLACAHGHVEIVDELLALGADVAAVINGGTTALHIAAQQGHVTLVSKLLDGGGDINATADQGATPLHLACQNGRIDLVKLLVSYDALSIDAHSAENQYTPLLKACQMGYFDIAKVLLDHGADVKKMKLDDQMRLFIAPKNKYMKLDSIFEEIGITVAV